MLIDDLLKDYDEYYVDDLKKSIASLVLTTSLVVNTKRNVSEMRQKVIDDFKYMVSAIRVSDMIFPNDKLFEFCEEKVLAQQNARLSLVFVKETYEEKGEQKVCNLKAHADIICKKGALDEVVELASDVEGVDIKPLEQRVLEANDGLKSFSFGVGVKGSDYIAHRRQVEIFCPKYLPDYDRLLNARFEQERRLKEEDSKLKEYLKDLERKRIDWLSKRR